MAMIETQDLTRQLKAKGCDAFAENMLKGATDTAAVVVKELQEEIERLRKCLKWQQDRDITVSTHSEGCYAWGNRHYECALREISSLREQVENCMFLVSRIENERNAIALALETENQVATRYAQQMAYWIEKCDVVRKERDELVSASEECRFALEPYDDVKPRDWRTDREKLARAHQTSRAALAKVGADKTGE